MRKLSLSILALLLAGASVIATAPAKTVTKSNCTTCTKEHCTKTANCPNKASCICK